MNRCRKRKCLHCHKLFRPDPRNTQRQRYCSSIPCRQASQAASQRRWLNKPENRDYFRGTDHVQRVQAWRQAHPGYGRRPKPQHRHALQERSLRQTVDCNKKIDLLMDSPLQDLLSQQLPVLIGLIASLSGYALQDDIVSITRRLVTLGEDILNHPNPQGGPFYATQTPAVPTTPAPHSPPVQLDRSTLGP